LNHFSVVRTSLINRLGGFRSGYEGSQDYDLMLRAIANIDESTIVHIPEILYHWRQFENSSSFSRNNAQKCRDAAIRAVNSFFLENGTNAIASENPFV